MFNRVDWLANSLPRLDRRRLAASLAVLPLLASILGSGCATKPQTATASTPLQISLAFRPNPIHLGPEQLTATVLDDAGKPVLGANVVIVTSKPVMQPNIPMKAVGMGETGVTYRAQEIGNGKYALAIEIREPAFWHFAVHAEGKNGRGDVLYHAQVTGH